MKRIERLKHVFTTPDGYKSVLSNKEREMNMSEYDRYQIVLKSRYIAAALKHALEVMPDGGTWKQCCDEALVDVNTAEGVDHFLDPGQFRIGTDPFVSMERHLMACYHRLERECLVFLMIIQM